MSRVMRRSVLILSLLAACSSDTSPGDGRTVRYARPVLRELLAKSPRPGPVATPADVSRAFEELLSEPAHEALWRSIGKAEDKGMLELYGVEYFHLDRHSYHALVLLRTVSGAACLYANADLHDASRPTVPAQPVSEAEFAALRFRIASHLPLGHVCSLASDSDSGEVVLVHVCAHGRSDSALWYAPMREPEPDRTSLAAARASYAVNSIVDALWVAAPLTMFPGDGDDAVEAYADLPGY